MEVNNCKSTWSDRILRRYEKSRPLKWKKPKEKHWASHITQSTVILPLLCFLDFYCMGLTAKGERIPYSPADRCLRCRTWEATAATLACQQSFDL